MAIYVDKAITMASNRSAIPIAIGSLVGVGVVVTSELSEVKYKNCMVMFSSCNYRLARYYSKNNQYNLSCRYGPQIDVS